MFLQQIEMARWGAGAGTPSFQPQGVCPRSSAGLISLTLSLGGCSRAQAPAIAMFGAYFPSWLACALAGIAGAVAVRLLFIPIGLDDLLPIRLPVYVAIAVAIGLLVSMQVFGR